jgi:DNA modification methylase
MSFELHHGDCLDVLRAMADNSVDAVVTDPPYGIRFMGKAWDGADIEARVADRQAASSHSPCAGPNGGHKSVAAEAGKYDTSLTANQAFQEWTQEWAKEALRVLKPGGYLLSFSSTRTYHRMASGVEDAGFEVRDQIGWMFGSGFPKSHNGEWGGTALKPAWEPIVMARKPLIGTVEANWRAHGTGALNIDGCRVAHVTVGDGNLALNPHLRAHINGGNGGHIIANEPDRRVVTPNQSGRWPANLIHDGSDEVVALFPANAGAQSPVKGTERSAACEGNITGERSRVPGQFHADNGSAARFFYCAKASRSDRNSGMPDPGPQFKQGSTLRDAENLNAANGRKGNHHPTVKPTDLMAYLCRLVTPPGGTVLDPFMGSGSTGKAAMREGFRFIGIEREAEYLQIAQARISSAYELSKSQPSQLNLLDAA